MGQWKHRITNVDADIRRGDCAECGPGIALVKKNYGGKREGFRWACWIAIRKNKGPSYGWQSEARRLLGRQGYIEMLELQHGLCAICSEKMVQPAVDHCHATKRVRGLLCRSCNVGLGFFKDDPERLRRAIDYLG